MAPPLAVAQLARSIHVLQLIISTTSSARGAHATPINVARRDSTTVLVWNREITRTRQTGAAQLASAWIDYR